MFNYDNKNTFIFGPQFYDLFGPVTFNPESLKLGFYPKKDIINDPHKKDIPTIDEIEKKAGKSK